MVKVATDVDVLVSMVIILAAIAFVWTWLDSRFDALEKKLQEREKHGTTTPPLLHSEDGGTHEPSD